ncbi:MAG: PAS domain S-box protein [Bryobacterales bacterium]
MRNSVAVQKLWPPDKGGSRAAAWIVLAVTLAATLAAWQVLRIEAADSVQRRFDVRLEIIQQWMIERARRCEIALYAGTGFVVASRNVTAEEWEHFVRSLQIAEACPGLTQLAYAARPDAVSRQYPAEDSTLVTADGEPDSLIVQLVAPGPLPPFGRDLGVVPEYREAAGKARDSSRTTVSTYQPPGKSSAASLPALFMPVYPEFEAPASAAERRRLGKGWLVAWFEPGVLLGALPAALARDLDVEVFAAEDRQASHRVYDSDPSQSAAAADGSSPFAVAMPLKVAGRVWTLAVEATPQFAGSEQQVPALVFLAGLISSLFLFVVTDTLASSRMRALATAKLMTERLRHNEAYSRAIVENAPVGILTFAGGGVLETVNSAAERMFGYRAHELAGCNFEQLLEEPSGLRARGYDGFLGFRSETGRRADGQAFPLELSVCRTEAGERRGYIAIVVDVTERVRAAQELRAERDFSAAVLNLVPALVVVADLKGRIVAYNHTCEETTGYSFDEVKEKELVNLLVPPEERAGARRIVGQLGSGVYPIHHEHHWTGKHGQRRLISWAHTTLLDTEGAPKYVIACGADVTEKREVEKATRRHVVELEHAKQTTERQAEMLARQASELAVARDAALESAHLKTQFLTNMSHEIRTPMSGVLGMTHLMLDTALDDEQRDYALTIRSSAEALLVILNDILDFSKIEAGKLEFETVDFNLTETVRSVVQLMGQPAAGKGVELKSSIGPDVPRWARGDAGRLRQVLLNLIGNAVKFTDHGTVEVSLTLKGATPDQIELNFSVRDTGIGIPPEIRKKLFQPFVQADGSTSRRHGGTGLGLAICKQLVERMGGEIECQSAPGEGSVFSFTAKLGVRQAQDFSSTPGNVPPKEAPALPAAQPGTATAPRQGGGNSHPGRRPRVLVAEDNVVNQKVAVRMLQRLGCEAEVAVNGREAVAALESVSFDLILMDCQMPEMDGYQAATEIRRRESGPDRLPIIALTAHAVQGSREKCLEAGMDDYLSKPINPRALSQMLRRWGLSTMELISEKVEAGDAAR